MGLEVNGGDTYTTEYLFLLMSVSQGYHPGSGGAGCRLSCHLHLAVIRTALFRPVSSEAGFFDSMKGGETYVCHHGPCPLRHSKNHRQFEVVYSFQAFLSQWMPRLVLAILALFQEEIVMHQDMRNVQSP